MNKFETLEGTLEWVKTKSPSLAYKATPSDPDRYQWSATLRPTQEALMKVMDMQALGVKNKLSKDEKGYRISFHRATETVDKKTGRVTEKFEAPKVFKADGFTEIEELIGNGSKGFLKVELREHNIAGGKKAYAARLHSVMVTDLIPYSPNA